MSVSIADKSESYLSETLSRYGQAILIGVIISVLIMFILPLPEIFLDVMLTLNIVGGLIILMSAVSVSDPMKLSSFSTLLLICTLFRLGLNVSSTRLILAHGQAGKIIHTFGHFVTGGNLLVGAVMFLVLMIIQFIVVSKGSERVAEVAARFTLDALPGKQMSIDADLRSGTLSSDGARDKRAELIRESRMFGSMDGAMKFVKGDAIAGFIITFVNIVGGLLVGVLQRGLPVSEAARLYSVLTIGDGLVSMIPSLLVALSAGFIVTRVGDAQQNSSLGGEIGRQVFAQPGTLLIVAGITFLLGFIPGFPTLLFMLIALAICGFVAVLSFGSRKQARSLNSVESHRVNRVFDAASLGHAVPLLLELGSAMYGQFLRDDRWRICLNELYPKLRNHLSNRMGVPFPELKITVNDALPKDRYRIKIYEIPVDEGMLCPEHGVIRTDAVGLAGENFSDAIREDKTAHGTPVMLISLDKQQDLIAKGVPVLAPEDMLLRHLVKLLKIHAEEFIGIQEVRDILNNVEKTHPELLREVVPRMLSIHKLTDVVKRLVNEGVPIKDFRLILETLSGCQPENKDPVSLTELVRIGLKRVITHLHAGADNRLPCFCLDVEIEEAIAAGIQKSGNECYLTLSPGQMENIVTAVRQAYHNHRIALSQAVILTHVEIRRYVRKILETDLVEVSVLSFQELDAKVIIDQKDTISLNDHDIVAV